MISIYFSDYRTGIVVADKDGRGGLNVKGLYSARNRGCLPITAEGLLRNLGDRPSGAAAVIDGSEIVRIQVELPALQRPVYAGMQNDVDTANVKRYTTELFEKAESRTPACIRVVDRELLADVSTVLAANKLSLSETFYGSDSEIIVIDALIASGAVDKECLIVNIKGEYISVSRYVGGKRTDERNIDFVIEGISFLEDVIVEAAIVGNGVTRVYLTGEAGLSLLNSIKAKSKGKTVSRLPVLENITGIDEFDFNAYIDVIGAFLA